MTTTCRACRLAWEHCHGAFVEQPDGEEVCSDDPACALPAAAHEHVERLEQPRRA